MANYARFKLVHQFIPQGCVPVGSFTTGVRLPRPMLSLLECFCILKTKYNVLTYLGCWVSIDSEWDEARFSSLCMLSVCTCDCTVIAPFWSSCGYFKFEAFSLCLCAVTSNVFACFSTLLLISQIKSLHFSCWVFNNLLKLSSGTWFIFSINWVWSNEENSRIWRG